MFKFWFTQTMTVSTEVDIPLLNLSILNLSLKSSAKQLLTAIGSSVSDTFQSSFDSKVYPMIILVLVSMLMAQYLTLKTWAIISSITS